MKRVLTGLALALALLAVGQQKASAWTKSSFSVGLSWSREAADNSFLWKVYRNGPHPFAQGGEFGGYGGGFAGVDGGMPYAGTPVERPTLPQLPAPKPLSNLTPTTGVQPATYWFPSYSWPGN